MNPNLKCSCPAHAPMQPVALAEALLAVPHRDELLALLRAD
ncbi:hypothetical protein VLK31_18965 [Variovorax sp. H27-G14]